VYAPPGFGDVLRSNGKFKLGRWRNENKNEEDSIFAQLLNHEDPGSDDLLLGYAREKMMELFVKWCPIPWQYDEL